MSKSRDFEANQLMLHHFVDQLPPQIMGAIGLAALMELAHSMAPEKFSEFVENAMQDAQQTNQDLTSSQNQEQSPQTAAQ